MVLENYALEEDPLVAFKRRRGDGGGGGDGGRGGGGTGRKDT